MEELIPPTVVMTPDRFNLAAEYAEEILEGMRDYLYECTDFSRDMLDERFTDAHAGEPISTVEAHPFMIDAKRFVEVWAMRDESLDIVRVAHPKIS